jgi:hypothetical protein
VIAKRVTRGPGGEPVLTVTVTGVDDVFRFAYHMMHGQCEFADKGRLTMRALRRQIGGPYFQAISRRMLGRARP